MQELNIPRYQPPEAATSCKPEAAPEFVTGTVSTQAGVIPRVSTGWSRADRIGEIKSRVGAFRMSYTVEPGLYAVGQPGRDSDVFASANYKLSFDILRRALSGMNAWILVLDTNGINVWCAAGKGTFSTAEMVKRIASSKLGEVVKHRVIIAPQLGAVGVRARQVEKLSGFKVRFGPVDAADIPEYVRAGYKKTEAMRLVKFTLKDRLVLTPMEINPAMKQYPWFAAAILLVAGLQPSGIIFADALNGLPLLLLGLLAVFTGAFVTPVLLPYVPFRSFALKGWLMGMIALVPAANMLDLAEKSLPYQAAAYLFFPMASSYIALQFTGSTTFTGMSGVKKELKIGIPVYLASTAVAALLLAASKLIDWRIL